MSAAAPEISVVIPCLNEEEAVGKVVDQALEGIRRSGRTGEVIVVDNASTDRSAEVAAEHGATVVREERPGYGSAYLAGLAANAIANAVLQVGIVLLVGHLLLGVSWPGDWLALGVFVVVALSEPVV